ncbi:hypothetical protein BDW74DRAFT_181928 [Aspergillus multicolor]|uniref:uncharacterized protein n=1 Tax=Aspergillus multicolor TaxID=41759 RepID=UPI003CCCC241
MGVADQKRFLSWLSQLDEAEPVIPPGDNQPSARFIFEGVPIEKQTLDTGLTSRKRPPQAQDLPQSRLGLEDFEQPHIPTRPTTKGTGSGISRIERNGYGRLPRAKTKEDRYEYKSKSSRVKSDRGATAQRKQSSRQKRKHTINEDFRASNVLLTRLTLQSATNMGIFNKGRRSSPVKTRVLDQGFSETNFLSKMPAHEQTSLPRRQKDSLWDYFGFGIETEKPLQGPSRIDFGMATPRDKESSQQQLDLGLNDNELYHNDDPASKADTAILPFSQSCSRGKGQNASERHIVCLQAEQAARDVPLQLLGFDLYSPNVSMSISTTKKYWTLEELKALMQQRISAWGQEDDGSTTAQAQTQRLSRKCKHTSPPGNETASTEWPRQNFARGRSQQLEINPTNSGTNSQASILHSFPNPRLRIQYSPGSPLAIRRNSGYNMTHGKFWPQGTSQNKGISAFDDEDTLLVSQAFDAAYEAIMQSEKDASLALPVSSPKRNESVGNNQPNPNQGLQAAWEWGLEDAILDPSHVEPDMLSPYKGDHYRASDATWTRDPRQQSSYLNELCIDRTVPRSIDENFTWRAPEIIGTETESLDLGPLENFWRQNKLY